MAKRTQSPGASSAADIAKLLAQAGPAKDLKKLIKEINASGDGFRGAGRALSSHYESIKNSLNAGEIAKALSQIPSTQNLARHIADINSSGEALKAASKDLSHRHEAIRNSLNTTGTAEALSRVNALRDLTKQLTDAIPRVNLKVPGVSEVITTALPRTLPDAYLLRSSETNAEDDAGAASAGISGRDTLGLEIISASDIGQLVRRAREARHLSQQSFADLAGVGRRFLSELENGKPTLELGKVLKVAHAAGISLLAQER